MIGKIKQTIIDFVKGGDTSDTVLLGIVLHKDFRVTNNGYMGTKCVKIINKENYLSYIKKSVFGGFPRKMRILNIVISDTMASVKLPLESEEKNFISYNSLVLDIDNKWKIINNLAVVQRKD